MPERYQAPRLWVRNRWSYSSGRQRSLAPGEIEARRGHPHDLVGHAIEEDALPDDRGIAAEALPPQALAQHHHVVPARLVLVGPKAAAHGGGHAQHVEERGARLPRRELHRLAAAGQGGAVRVVDREGLEGLGLVLEVEEVLGRDHGRPALPDVVHDHQAVGLRIRQRPQENGVHRAEYRRVGPDAQGQRGDRHEGETGSPPETTKGIPNVLNQRFHANPRVGSM